eukprot:gene23407-29624_t
MWSMSKCCSVASMAFCTLSGVPVPMVSATSTRCTPICFIKPARAAHGAAHGPAHCDARRQRRLHHGCKAFHAFFDGAVDVLLAEGLAGGTKDHDFMRARSHRRLKAHHVGREHRIAHAHLALNARHHDRVVGHLRHPLRGHKTGDLDLGEARGLQAVHQTDFDFGRDRWLFVLQAVAGADVDELNAGR